MKEDFLQKYNGNFKSLIDLLGNITNDGISIIKENVGIIYLNQKGCELLDINYEKLTPENIISITSNEMRMKYFQNLLSKKFRSVFHVNNRFIGTHDFTTIKMEIQNGIGEEEFAVCRFRDITEDFDRKEMEEYLYSEAPIGVFKILYKNNFKFLYGSEFFYELNNITSENTDELNKYYRKTKTIPVFFEKYLTAIKSAIDNYESSCLFEVEIPIDDDNTRFVMVQCTITKIYDDYIIYGFNIDNTSQKLQEIEMQELHSINGFTIEKDYLNVLTIDIAKKQYQLIVSEVSGKFPTKGNMELLQQLIDLKILREDLEKSGFQINLDNIILQLESQNSYSLKLRYKKVNKIIWSQVEVSYFSNSKDKILICMRDIDKDEKKKEELIEAMEKAKRANRAKSDFLSRMSHDIRTPLNTIIGMTSLSSMYLNNPEKIKESLKKIDNASKFLLSIINDVLDMSKIESGKMELNLDDFNFKEFLCSVTHISYNSASQKGIDFNVTSDPNLKRYYYADLLRLRQIIMNLLSNAIKFTAKQNGIINLRVDLIERIKDRDLIRFTVSDNGVGMSKEFQNKLFKPFEQESVNQSGLVGTGLGLSICHSLVKLMNGTISAISEPNQGSSFIVEIPLNTSNRKENYVTNEYYIEKNLKVLIIDDDEITCQHTSAILNNAGVKADYVFNGSDGIEKIKNSTKEGYVYDLIIVDWKMPEMDGYETCSKIRKIVGDDVLIFIMSSFDWAEIEDSARENGVNHFISKPMFVDDIHYMIQSLENNESRKIKEKKSESEIKFNEEKILLVEDNEINAEILKTLLECYNLNVTLAADGKIALDKFEESSLNEYRVILMDIRMPVMNGLEATKKIRALDRDDATSIPIFALSANAFAEDIENSINAGMNEHLCKPIDIKEITAKLKEYIQ